MPKILPEEDVGRGRVAWALALFHPDDPTKLTLAAVSLVPDRRKAEGDLAKIAADYPEGLYTVVGIGYEFLRERLPMLPLVTGVERTDLYGERPGEKRP